MTHEELEKEAEEKYNEQLKQNGYKVEYRNETYINGYLDSAEPREKRITELEEKNKWYSEQVCNKECAEVWGQLTKAKDHIKKLLDCLQQDTNDPQTNYYVIKYMTEAEQFLSEVEK